MFQGTKVTVWCDSNSNTELGGDAVIVCDEDYDYLYDKKPVCVERGKSHLPHLSAFYVQRVLIESDCN